MATEVKIQQLVHYLEHGKGRWWIGFSVILAATAFLVYMFLFRKEQNNFRGLTHQQGIEQAVIAREIVRGNGFSTKIFTPLAIYKVEKEKGKNAFSALMSGESAGDDSSIATEKPVPDLYHAPLWPWVNSLALGLGEKINNSFQWRKDEDGKPDFWVMQATEYFPVADRFIAFVSVVFFLLAVAVNYLIAARLFDNRLALIGVGILLICDHFWQFSFTGLPQMLMLFLFSVAVYFLVRAVAAKDEDKWTWPWFIGAGISFGLLGMTHGLTTWIFIGALVFTLIAFRPWGRDAAIMLVIFLAMMTPWMIRNYNICGDPLGLAGDARYFQIRGTESQIMRTLYLKDDTVDPLNFRAKIQSQFLAQMGGIFFYCGKIIVAPLFILALIQIFKRKDTALFRWGVLTMLMFAILGMCYFGFNDGAFQSNDLYILFIPIMTFYGLAVVLMMWSKLEIRLRIVNLTFLGLLFGLSAPSLINTFTDPSRMVVAFPPYAPGAISKMHDWFGEKDVICSDMPWAVAWYADRKSLWLPMTMSDFFELNDFRFNGRVTGLLLTPITGYKGLLDEISTPEFSEWAPFILRQPNARANFPLQATAVLPFSIRRTFPFILFADRDRWSERGD